MAVKFKIISKELCQDLGNLTLASGALATSTALGIQGMQQFSSGDYLFMAADFAGAAYAMTRMWKYDDKLTASIRRQKFVLKFLKPQP